MLVCREENVHLPSQLLWGSINPLHESFSPPEATALFLCLESGLHYGHSCFLQVSEEMVLLQRDLPWPLTQKSSLTPSQHTVGHTITQPSVYFISLTTTHNYLTCLLLFCLQAAPFHMHTYL